MLATLAGLNLLAAPASAQSLLPKGVGAVQLGYRSYATQTSRFDSSGDAVALGAAFDQSFSGSELLQGGHGDLKRLARELQQYEQNLRGGGSLVNDLDLGTLQGDVRADVSAYTLGMAFGLTRRITLFAGIPWVSASVRTSLSMSGTNNAAEIRDRLGDLAFDELKAGLTRASLLNASAVEQTIEDAGYAPIDAWSRQGPGDARLGARAGFDGAVTRRVRYGATATTTLILPTGAADDPDALTDVKTGNGYVGLDLALDQRLVAFRSLYAGAVTAYTVNFQTEAEKRVPVDGEAIVAADRKARVTYAPGDDADVAAYVGARRWGADAGYRLGLKRHFADSYEGSLEGDYASLARGSDASQLYQRISLSYDTVAAYKRRAFPLPFIVALSANSSIAGRNTTKDDYYELAVTGFFSAP